MHQLFVILAQNVICNETICVHLRNIYLCIYKKTSAELNLILINGKTKIIFYLLFEHE